MNESIAQALDGQRGDIQKEIAQVGLQVVEQLLAKNKAYGSAAFASSPVLCPGMPADLALRVRMSDKIARLTNLLANPDIDTLGESVDDSMFDWIGYGILWLVSKSLQKQQKIKQELDASWLATQAEAVPAEAVPSVDETGSDRPES